MTSGIPAVRAARWSRSAWCLRLRMINVRPGLRNASLSSRSTHARHTPCVTSGLAKGGFTPMNRWHHAHTRNIGDLGRDYNPEVMGIEPDSQAAL
jgi:hypothetical protein